MPWPSYGGLKGIVTMPLAFFAKSRVIPLVHRRTRMPLDLVVARDSLETAFLNLTGREYRE